MRIDAVEVPRTLADTEKMVKCITFKSNDKVRFYCKIRKCFTVFCDCTICYRKLYCFTLCQTSLISTSLCFEFMQAVA